MTDKQIIDCEYLETGQIKFCNALNISFYNDFICNKGNCIILKVEEQLKAKEQECVKLKQALVKVKNMVEKSRDELYHCDSIIYADDRLVEILYVINEVLPHDSQQ